VAELVIAMIISFKKISKNNSRRQYEIQAGKRVSVKGGIPCQSPPTMPLKGTAL
jgi:hypothetical protein